MAIKVRQFRVTYVHCPDVQIMKDDATAQKLVDSPQVVTEGTEIAEIQDQEPIIMSTWGTVCVFTLDVSPVQRISAYDCVHRIHETNESIAAWDDLDLATLRTLRTRRRI